MVKVTQINLGRRHGAANELCVRVEKEKTTIAFIQEPPMVRGKVKNIYGGVNFYSVKRINDEPTMPRA
jgi:hypothetical protein